MDNVAPIRPDVQPAMDIPREMIQFVAEKINEYVKENGCEPVSIAFALIGPDAGNSISSAWSWSPGDENRSRLQCCSVASALLMKRALGV